VKPRFGTKRSAVIAGVSMTPQGDLSDRPQPTVYWEVVKAALADAGLQLSDVDGLIDYAPDGAGLRSALPGSAMADLLGRPVRFQATTWVGAAGTAAGMALAIMAIENGMAEVVILPTVVAGQAAGYFGADRDAAIAAMAKLGTPYEWLWGTTRVADYAVIAQRHMHEYGTRPEQLAEVAVAARHSATLHPLSAMGKKGEITVDAVLGSKMIATPLHLLDSCIVNQGGGCVVIAAEERIDAGRPKIRMLGYAQAHAYLDPCHLESLTSFTGAQAADEAFAMSGVGRDEIDVVAMSDHFTINTLIGLEDAGFCRKGEGGAFVEGGALRHDGRLPTNTGGGYLSGTHAGLSGTFGLIEMVEQLRGSAGARQVKDARLGYMHGMGGVFSNHFAAVLARD
jgi:acetyl-CoA acetyltransferase